MSGMTMSSGVPNGTPGVTTGAVEFTESSGRALKLQTDTPHLVSMGGDRLSTAVTLHPIPQGRVTLGSGHGVDIPVHGTGVLPLHCHIENSEGIVTIYPIADNLSIDGIPLHGPTRLSQGVMLTIGRSNYMRFNHPAEAKIMKSVLPNSRISMAPITFDNNDNHSNKINKKPPSFPRKSPRESYSGDEEPPSNIMMKVSKFEYLAAQNFKKSISPKVFLSNSVTVNTPARDVLGKAPPDIHNYTKNISQPAINYSETNYIDKQKNKTPDRQIFGCKNASYVNVTLNETKTINNKVVIFENGCIIKPQNVTYEQPHELNNITRNIASNQTPNKNVNVNRGTTAMPSPSYNRNTGPMFRSVMSSPVTTNGNFENRLSGSMGDLSKGNHVGSNDDLVYRKNDAELRRNQAQVDRIKEQEIEKAEQTRLEEILNMCAEYEKQSQCEKSNKPTPNRIKTNGSLPRDKRNCISPNLLNSQNHLSTSPSPSHDNHIFQFETEHIHQNATNQQSFENVHSNSMYYENVEIRTPGSSGDIKNCGSPYENVTITQGNGIPHFQQSPRTRIKTFITSNKDSLPKDSTEMIESKYAILQAEHKLLLTKSKEASANYRNGTNDTTPTYKSKTLPPKFILPMDYQDENGYGRHLENYENLTLNNHSASIGNNLNLTSNKENQNPKVAKDDGFVKAKIDHLKAEKKDNLGLIARLKRQMADIENQGEELNRGLELEKALIVGEYKSKQLDLEKLENRKDELTAKAEIIDDKMNESQIIQEADQRECKEKLDEAEESMNKTENNLSQLEKSTDAYNATFEEYLLAQEVLDNERKNFEDLEFHHLEEEADWLASREELQREILDLSQRIDDVSNQIIELEKQNQLANESNVEECTKMEEQRIEYSKKIEEIRNRIKDIDTELSNFIDKETDDELSTDSDSDRYKDLETLRKEVSNLSLNHITDLSCSFIVSSTKIMEEDFNMSQSFNEKMLQEKSILDDGLGKRFPSQDDIDRISKVTTDAPMNIDDGRGSLGKKTIESLKELERNRQLHLVQQGSQVIENERRRVLALKQKVQNEVRTKWAHEKRKQDCSSFTSTGSDETQNGIMDSESSKDESSPNNLSSINQDRTESEGADSPRPLSETSDVSSTAGTLGRRRNQRADKHRPLTRYLPIRSSELDLRQHIESAGHQVVLCPHVLINNTSCRGFLHKKGSKLNGWSRRWFVFDRIKRALVYYSDKSEKKVRGGAYFQAIEEVYLDHANSVKSHNPQLTFIVKTHERCYYLMAPSPEAMRIWIDVIFTGAEGYQEFEHGT